MTGKLFKGKNKRFHQLLLLILLSICIFQCVMVINGYAFLMSKRIWRNRSLDSYGRSAVFFLGSTGADFMRFIAKNTPVDKSVVVAERSASFASQNVLQFYLLPRAIVACDCEILGGKCNPCLQSPDSFIPVTKNFPPPGSVGTEKVFTKFSPGSGNDSDYYLGIYGPKQVDQQSPDVDGVWDFRLFIKALFMDIIVLFCLGFLGFVGTHLVFSEINFLDALSLAIPAGAAIFSWSIFLTSWAGLSITLNNIIILYLSSIFLFLIFSKLFSKRRIFQVNISERNNYFSQIRNLDWPSIVLIAGIIAMVVLAFFISVGRGYSNYDDIAIWSLKGYGIAAKNSIFADHLLGGHALAYPLSLPLSITIFKLASGDMLPGSKLLIPIYTVALLWGCFRFLTRHGVNSRIALIGIFLLITVPQYFYYTTLGYANVPFTACLLLGVLWGINGLMDGNKGELLISSFLFGFSGWMRPEGTLFAGILILVLLAWYFLVKGWKTWRLGFWLLPGLVIPFVWLIFARNYVLEDQAGGALKALFNQTQDGHFINLEPLIMTARYGIDTFFNPKTWGLILPLVLILFIIALPRLIRRPNRVALPLFLATLVTFLIPAALFFVESTTEGSFSTFLSMSFDRAYLPAMILSIITILIIFFSNPNAALSDASPLVNHERK
jgi:hypothetical protein